MLIPFSSKVASIALLIIFSIPLASLGLYSYLGSPDKSDAPYSKGQLKSENKYANKNLETLLKRLKKQLDKEPNKIEGWILLGRSLVTLGKYREASEALKHALQIAPNRPDLAASIAETKFFANQGKFSLEIRHFLNLAQRLNPREHKALYYLGLDAFNQKLFRKAIQYWVNLLSISPAQSAWINIVRERLTQAAVASNLRVSDFTPQVLGAPKKRAETIENWGPGPTKEDIEKAEQMTERERSQFIRSMVDRLAKRLIDEPNDLNGWRRLAHAYRVLGQPKKAEEAQQRVKELQK